MATVGRGFGVANELEKAAPLLEPLPSAAWSRGDRRVRMMRRPGVSHRPRPAMQWTPSGLKPIE